MRRYTDDFAVDFGIAWLQVNLTQTAVSPKNADTGPSGRPERLHVPVGICRRIIGSFHCFPTYIHTMLFRLTRRVSTNKRAVVSDGIKGQPNVADSHLVKAQIAWNPGDSSEAAKTILAYLDAAKNMAEAQYHPADVHPRRKGYRNARVC